MPGFLLQTLFIFMILSTWALGGVYIGQSVLGAEFWTWTKSFTVETTFWRIIAAVPFAFISLLILPFYNHIREYKMFIGEGIMFFVSLTGEILYHFGVYGKTGKNIENITLFFTESSRKSHPFWGSVEGAIRKAKGETGSFRGPSPARERGPSPVRTNRPVTVAGLYGGQGNVSVEKAKDDTST